MAARQLCLLPNCVVWKQCNAVGNFTICVDLFYRTIIICNDICFWLLQDHKKHYNRKSNALSLVCTPFSTMQKSKPMTTYFSLSGIMPHLSSVGFNMLQTAILLGTTICLYAVSLLKAFIRFHPHNTISKTRNIS